jgi:1,4-dihydroxy-2-naphthoate octaprenyltransferase
MARIADWIEGARPRTLPAAVAPVLLGSGAAAQVGGFSLPRALLAAGVALALQVGVNYANDYSDGVRGTDENRTGPQRLTGGGLAAPTSVLAAALASFGVAAVLGLVLLALSGAWWLLAAGALAIVAAWGYTGGRRPYGYLGLGEVFVFAFFGLLATAGTTYTQAATVPWTGWVAAVGVGLIACALLMVNNIRDIPTDTPAGKRTLAVRLGDRPSRVVYVAMLGVALALGIACALAAPWSLLVILGAPLIVACCLPVLRGRTGRDLIVVLRNTGFAQLAYGILLGRGLAL